MNRGEISPAILHNSSEDALLRIAQSFGSAGNLNSAGFKHRAEEMRCIIAHPNVEDYTLNVLSNFFNVPPDFQVELAELVANHPKGENALNQGMYIPHAAPENRVAIGAVMMASPKLSLRTFSKQIVSGFRSEYYHPDGFLKFHGNIDFYAEQKPGGEDQKVPRTQEALLLARDALKSKLMDANNLRIMTANFSLFPQVLEGVVYHPKTDAGVLDHLIRMHADSKNCHGAVAAAVDMADKKGFNLSEEALVKLKAVFPADPRFRFVGQRHYQV